jgi:O-antigen/teichoic acid export membrane protein
MQRSNTRTVASNTFWWGFDSGLGIVVAFATSIPLARLMGPERLGYFSYMVWLTNMGTIIGGLGIPGAAGKFMAEHLGRGETAIARAIYGRMLHLQAIAALAVTSIALLLVHSIGDVHYRPVSTILVAAILPTMLSAVPSQANLANESVRTNIPSSIAFSVIYVVGVVLSLCFSWNLLGVAIGFLAAKWAEFILRFAITYRWMSTFPRVRLSSDLERRIFRFTLQQMLMAILVLVVWDKSDVVLLKAFNHDIRQVTFFAVVFNLVEKALVFPQVLAGSLSTTLLAQYGRDRKSVSDMAIRSALYTFLFAAPLLFGLVLVSSPLIRLLYGPKYLEAIPVLGVAAGFAALRPLAYPVDAIFRANARLGRMVLWTVICAAFNIGTDALLIPHYGAIGAAIGNGAAQTLSVAGYWFLARRDFQAGLDLRSMIKIAVSALAMAPISILFNKTLPPMAALLSDVLAGMLVFIIMVRLTRVLQPSDARRMVDIRDMLPKAIRPKVNSVMTFVLGENV